ncbi:hydrolase, partial [Lactiplantibacillus plantarum]
DDYEAEHEFFGPLRMKVAKQLDRFRGKVSAG